VNYFANPYAANQAPRRVLDRIGPDDWNVYAEYQEGATTYREKLGGVKRYGATEWLAYSELGDPIYSPTGNYFSSRAAAARAVWDRALHGAYY
jgi:hypothetical protein